MEMVGSFDAKTHLAQLLERVANGEEFTITRHGKPVARLVPAGESRPVPNIRHAIEEMRVFRQRQTLGADLTVREMIDEGRRY